MGIATGLLIGGAIAKGVSSIVAAHKASSAAKKSSEQLVDAANESTRIVDESYKPFVTRGAQALQTLGRLTSAPPGSKYAAPDYSQAAPQAINPNTPGSRPQGANPQTGTAMPRTLGGLAQSPTPINGGAVPVRAPDGSVKPVPAASVNDFLARNPTFQRAG